MSTNERRLQILIIGGGVGGLSAASFLREHHDVTILERSEREFPNDYGISVVANAYGLLQKHGVKEENFPHCVLTHMRVRDKDNGSILDFMFDTRKTVGAPSILTKRSAIAADISRLATDDTCAGSPARVIRGAKVVDIDIANTTVKTEDGRTFTGDIIIGADGINSAVRAAIEQYKAAVDSSAELKQTHPRPSGLIAYVSSVPREVFTSDPDLSFQADVENAASFTTYYGSEGIGSRSRLLAYPINKTHFQIVGYFPETAWVSEFEGTKSTIIKGIPSERVVQDFKNFHSSVQKLFSSASTFDVWRIRDLPPLSSWSSGRVILIGDAAHAATPHTGHGANMAMEDGEALGYVFRDIASAEIDTPGQLDAAIKERFALFESVRIVRSQYVQKSARLASGIASPQEGRFNPQAFSRTMHYYTGAEAAIMSPSSQPSYEI